VSAITADGLLNILANGGLKILVTHLTDPSNKCFIWPKQHSKVINFSSRAQTIRWWWNAFPVPSFKELFCRVIKNKLFDYFSSLDWHKFM